MDLGVNYLHKILNNKLLFCLLITLCIVSKQGFTQQMNKENTNAKIKAIFVYNFTKYFEWPPNYRAENFVITVIGDLALYKELKEMAKDKKVGSQAFEIRTAITLNEIEKSHMLIISNSYSNLLNEVPVKMKGKSILVIADKPGAAKNGAAINFVAVDNKQKFELNKKNAEKYGLVVSSNLEKLAIQVE